jgi:hypothetical protein
MAGEMRVKKDLVGLVKAKRRDYLREVLRAAGLTNMSALAEKLGKTPPALANIQNAKRSASRKLIEKIR